jgi:hypothetical protein
MSSSRTEFPHHLSFLLPHTNVVHTRIRPQNQTGTVKSRLTQGNIEVLCGVAWGPRPLNETEHDEAAVCVDVSEGRTSLTGPLA